MHKDPRFWHISAKPKCPAALRHPFVHANTAREAMDNLELQHSEFSTTSAKKIC